jgi:hypothetical protein
MRSTPYTEVLEEARAMVADGYRELVLTGVLIGDYGPETGSGGPDLAELCAMLGEIDGLERIRISSIEPTLVSDRLIDLIATHPKMCPTCISAAERRHGRPAGDEPPLRPGVLLRLDTPPAGAHPQLRD